MRYKMISFRVKGGGDMRNNEIRTLAKAKGVKMWQIAEALHMQDSAFSRKLRHELPEEEKSTILAIIDDLAKEAI